jgi:predicted short-subunit dehydrogenase-like oxidoreductase (DUF2520 family)
MISTDTNLRSRGTKRALSGPVARGAEGIVAGHLEALGGMDPDAEELYRVLTRIMKRLVDSGKQEG